MKKELAQAMVAAKTALLLLWPVSAWASAIVFGEKMAQIPLLAVLMTVILSTLSGVTALLHAMKQEYEAHGEIPRLWLFVASKMLGSNVAGMLMFFGAETWNFSDTMEAGAIILAGFGGTWTIERALQFFTNKYAPEATK